MLLAASYALGLGIFGVGSGYLHSDAEWSLQAGIPSMSIRNSEGFRVFRPAYRRGRGVLANFLWTGLRV